MFELPTDNMFEAISGAIILLILTIAFQQYMFRRGTERISAYHPVIQFVYLYGEFIVGVFFLIFELIKVVVFIIVKLIKLSITIVNIMWKLTWRMWNLLKRIV